MKEAVVAVVGGFVKPGIFSWISITFNAEPTTAVIT
jgi:hypothetical protein